MCVPLRRRPFDDWLQFEQIWGSDTAGNGTGRMHHFSLKISGTEKIYNSNDQFALPCAPADLRSKVIHPTARLKDMGGVIKMWYGPKKSYPVLDFWIVWDIQSFRIGGIYHKNKITRNFFKILINFM